MCRYLLSLLLTLCCLLNGSAVQAQGDPAKEVVQRVNAFDPSRGVPQAQATPVPDVPFTAPFVLSEPDEHGAIYHPVQPGQTAWTIAAHYGIDLAQLYALNNITEDSVIQIGARLLIQPPYTPTVTPTLTRPPTTPTPSPTGASVTPSSANGSGTSFANSARMVVLFLLIAMGVTLLTGILIISRWKK